MRPHMTVMASPPLSVADRCSSLKRLWWSITRASEQGPGSLSINNPDLPKVTRRACLGISPSVPCPSLPGTPVGGGRGSMLPAATSTWPLPSSWELTDGEVEMQTGPAQTCCLTPGREPCLLRPQGMSTRS